MWYETSEVMVDTSKTSVSVLSCISADRTILQPYTIYKAKHMYPTWVDCGRIKLAYYNKNESV